MGWLDKYFRSGVKNAAAGGNLLPAELVLNFVSGATLVDNPTNGTTDITIAGSSADTPVFFAALATLAPAGSRQVVFLDGYASVNDGGGGMFEWSAADVSTPDNATIVQVTGISVGRWRRAAATGSIAEVPWFGGGSNANYFDSSNGKWYVDSGFTTEASDDAAKIVAAKAYCVARGGGTVHIPSGVWYMKTTHGTHQEFVTVASNVHFVGDGPGTILFVAGASNTVGTGGYACVIGDGSDYYGGTNPAYVNIQVRNLSIDHNSAHNQYPNANRAGVTYATEAGVMFPSGTDVIVDNVTGYNLNGIFGILNGSYGHPELCINPRITNCSYEHIGDDPHIGDSSVIAGGFTNGVVTGNRLYMGAQSLSSWTTLNPCPVSAFEMHPIGMTFANNLARGQSTTIAFGVGLNLAGDSHDAVQVLVNGNVFTNVVSGVSLYSIDGMKMQQVEICNNLMQIVTGSTASNGECGIQTAIASILGASAGLGIYDAKIHHNTIIFVGASPSTRSIGIYFAEQTGVFPYGGGTEIAFNKIVGFGSTGIETDTDLVVGGQPGTLNHVRIRSNDIINSGTTGITIFGGGTGSVTYGWLEVTNNTITDDRGGSSVLTYGVYVATYTDVNTLVWGNNVSGYLTGDVYLDAATFTAASHKWPKGAAATFNNVLVDNTYPAGLGANVVPSFFLQNRVAATNSVNQYPGGVQYEGTYWDGTDSAQFLANENWVPSASVPAKLTTVTLDGGSAHTVFYNYYEPGSNLVGWAAAGNLIIDMSSGLGIEERFSSSSGYWKVTNAGLANVMVATATGGGDSSLQFGANVTIGAFGVTPVVQQTRAGTITSGAGVSGSGTSDVGSSFNQTTLNNNFATIVNRLAALDLALHNLGWTT